MTTGARRGRAARAGRTATCGVRRWSSARPARRRSSRGRTGAPRPTARSATSADQPRITGPSGVQPELELGHDAEVAARAPHPPEEIGVLVLARLDQLAVGGDDIDGEQLIDRQAPLAHQPADAAAERQARHTGVRDDPGRHGQPEGLGLAIEIT